MLGAGIPVRKSPTTYDARVAVSGEGPAVVLVSGMDGTGDLFYRQVPLLQRSHTVATFALREDAQRMEELAADVEAVIERAAPRERKAIVIGESFGGAVALTLAVTNPDCVSALVVLNSFPYFTPQFRLRLAQVGIKCLPWGAMAAVRYATAFFLHSRHTHRTELRKFIELTSRTSRSGYENRLKLLRTYDVRDRLTEIRCPTLFLAAEKDHLVPSVPQARYMAEKVPHASLRVLSGHGHICLIAPDVDLAKILDDWQTSYLRPTNILNKRT